MLHLAGDRGLAKRLLYFRRVSSSFTFYPCHRRQQVPITHVLCRRWNAYQATIRHVRKGGIAEPAIEQKQTVTTQATETRFALKRSAQSHHLSTPGCCLQFSSLAVSYNHPLCSVQTSSAPPFVFVLFLFAKSFHCGSHCV